MLVGAVNHHLSSEAPAQPERQEPPSDAAGKLRKDWGKRIRVAALSTQRQGNSHLRIHKVPGVIIKVGGDAVGGNPRGIELLYGGVQYCLDKPGALSPGRVLGLKPVAKPWVLQLVYRGHGDRSRTLPPKPHRQPRLWGVWSRPALPSEAVKRFCIKPLLHNKHSIPRGGDRRGYW